MLLAVLSASLALYDNQQQRSNGGCWDRKAVKPHEQEYPAGKTGRTKGGKGSEGSIGSMYRGQKGGVKISKWG